MVSQGLTEAALRRLDYSSGFTNFPKDPPGDILRDPPGAIAIGDDYDGWSARGSSNEDSSGDSEINLAEGDEEDDGLFIGANDNMSDDSTIAFSDIVLPTEEEDPFLLELAEAAVQEAVDQVEMEGVVSGMDFPTLAPKPQPRPVTFSAHAIVAHKSAARKAEIMNMSQEELLAQLEKRLRPYMGLPRKLPPLRKRKRPNCMFLNHMGSRRKPAPVNKRKLATATEVQTPRKKRAMPTLPKSSATTTTPAPKPQTVTAPSSPTPCKPKIIAVPTKPVPSVPPMSVLPKFLTDPAWAEDMVEDAAEVETKKQPKKTIKLKSNKATSNDPPSTPPLKAVENKTDNSVAAQVLRDIQAVKQRHVTACPPSKSKPLRKEEAPKKRSYTKKAAKAKKVEPAQSDPPGTTASVVTPESKRSETSSEGDISCVHSMHEPLAPSFENSFQWHHDSLASLLGDDSNQDNSSLSFHLPPTPPSPSKTKPCRRERVVPPEVLIPLHDELPPPSRNQEGDPRTPKGNQRSYVALDHRAEHQHGVPAPPRRSYGRPMLLSPEMDMLSPSSRYGSHHAYELGMDDDHLASASPTFNHPRRVVPVCMGSPKMPVYTATPDHYRHTVGGEQMYYRRGPAYRYGGPYDEWATPVAPSSPTPYVTPDGLGAPYRKKIVESPNQDWMMESAFPCPPLVEGGYDHPHHSIYHQPLSPTEFGRPKESVKPTKKGESSKKSAAKRVKATNNGPASVSPSPVRSADTVHKIDYSDYRKTMSLRSGRKVDCPLEEKEVPELPPNATAGVAA